MQNNPLRYILILFVWLYLASHSYSQQINGVKSDSAYVQFEQNFNIYQWRYGFNYQKNINQKGFLQITEDFKSSLLRIRENENKWKDDQLLTVDFSWRLTPKWVGKILASSLLFSDKLSGITNDIKTSFGSLGIQYNPINMVNISSLLGYKFDERFDQLDQGVMYSFDLMTSDINLKDYQNRFSLFMTGDDFSVRKNKDFNFNYQVSKEFYTETADSLSMTWYSRRRDNYDRWDSDKLFIESLDEELGTIHNILHYRVSNVMKVKLTSELTSRRTKVSKLNFDKINEQRSKRDVSSFNDLSVDFKTDRVSEKIVLTYSNESQKNDVPDSLKNSPFSFRFTYLSSDFRSSRLSLSNTFNLFLSKRDSIFTNLLVSIYRYDTPEENNYDDHDELRINSSFSALHYFSPLLKLKLNASVNLKHLVFVFGEKSANNNWMRIFRLNPEIVYQPTSRFKLYQSFDVLANYVSYDFEQQISPTDIRSFVFRKFTMQQVLSYSLSRLATFNMNYRLELEDNGKLFWDRWTEILITSRQNQYGKVMFDFHLFPGVTLSLGTVFYKRKEHFHTLESASNNRISNNYTSFGPIMSINYEPHSKLKFSLYGVRRTIDRVQQRRYFINNINANLRWFF